MNLFQVIAKVHHADKDMQFAISIAFLKGSFEMLEEK